MEAHADMELRELQLYKPDASVGGKLLPKKKDRVLCIQVSSESLIVTPISISISISISSHVVWYSFTALHCLVI